MKTRRTYRTRFARLRDAAIWRRGHARLIWGYLVGRGREEQTRIADRDHLLAAEAWLARAQDACPDGGVSGCYRLRGGWEPASVSSTARAVPTFLALEDEAFHDRARRCVECLLRSQFESGPFADVPRSAGEQPASLLATAQAVEALVAWNLATGDPSSAECARRAADWLVSQGDSPAPASERDAALGPVGCMACAAGALAGLGARTGAAIYLDAAWQRLAFVLGLRDPDTGWLDSPGTTQAIGLTLSGLLHASEVLDSREGATATTVAAEAVARRLELERGLAGALDDHWRSLADAACLSGTAEMALLWLRLYEREGDSRLLNAALKALDAVKRSQPMFSSSPDIRGGVPGSDPIWGPWHSMALSTDAAEPFVDVLLAKRRVMADLASRRPRGCAMPPDVPMSLPSLPAVEAPRRPRIIMFSQLASAEVPKMILAWSSWEFKPDAVVFLARRPPETWARRKEDVDDERLAARWRRGRARLGQLSARLRSTIARAKPEREKVEAAAFCLERGIPFFVVESLDDSKGLEVVRSLEPDLAIYAEAGILRAPLLAIPRLGTVNAHSGMLPCYRGVHTWAWARLHGDPAGCSVHLIDEGIDTGDILVVGAVTERARGRRELWALHRQARTELLGQVVRYVASNGELPPRRPQRREEGRQYFRMHQELLKHLDRELREI